MHGSCNRATNSRWAEAPELLAHARVGDSDHRDLDHGRVFLERRFDLGGKEILPAADHHLLEQSGDPAVAALVHRREVAVCSQPLASMAVAVASGLSKYSSITRQPRVQISPTTSGATILPLAGSTIFTSVCGSAVPTVSALSPNASSGRTSVITGRIRSKRGRW